jgi:hypothetical protein
MEMLILGKVACFSRSGQLCYISNRRLGREFGIKTERARGIVHQLVTKGVLTKETVRRNTIIERLAQQGQNGFCGKRGRWYRLLAPTDRRLHRYRQDDTRDYSDIVSDDGIIDDDDDAWIEWDDD